MSMSKQKLRVGIIFGGRSGEHEVSLISARSVMEAIDKNKYEVVPIGITKEGRWITGGDPLRQLTAAARLLIPVESEDVLSRSTNGHATPPLPVIRRAEGLPTERPAPVEVDVIFPVVHGPYGEDGTLQGLLELANIPYVGAGVLASAVGMDKAIMKGIFRQAGLPVVDYMVLLRRRWESAPEEMLVEIEARFGYPCFVKPANLGSSVGVNKAHHRQELIRALDEAARYDRKLIVERAVDAREIEVSVLGNDEPEASVPGEVVPAREFYDYRAKYLDERTRLIIPADLPSETTAEVRRLAILAFKAIDCAGLARVDFLIDRHTGSIYINEINTIPGLTPVSAYPKLWEATGIGFTELIDRLIQLALERYQEKSRNRTSYELNG